MQKFTFIAALFAASLSFASAQPSSTSSLGREDYSDRSSQDLRQLRAQVDAVAQRASQPEQVRFAPIYDALSAAEDALGQWKMAAPLEEAQRRADFEKARNLAVKAWNDFRGTRVGT